jgi:hypothetical protein
MRKYPRSRVTRKRIARECDLALAQVNASLAKLETHKLITTFKDATGVETFVLHPRRFPKDLLQ